MALIKCPECGKEVEAPAKRCLSCGYPFSNEGIIQCGGIDQDNDLQKEEKIIYNSTGESEITEENKKDNLRIVKNWLIMISICCAIFSGVFFYKGYDVKNNYYNSEYSILSENAYVGGDAYNYIINGTYFTGYMVIGSALMICAVIIGTSAINVYTRIKLRKEEK